MRLLTLIALSFSLPACPPRGQEQPIVVEPPAEEDPGPGEPPPAEDPPQTSGGGDNLNIGEDPCETDEDCVPAGCCHASACVAAGNAPSCEDQMCTMDCQFGTMDCGGGCLCHEGRCTARLSEAPEAIRNMNSEN